MRSVLAFGVLIALCASADATPRHYHHLHHHLYMSSRAASSFAAVPVWGYEGFRPVYNADTPRYNDASKYGGPTALSAE